MKAGRVALIGHPPHPLTGKGRAKMHPAREAQGHYCAMQMLNGHRGYTRTH